MNVLILDPSCRNDAHSHHYNSVLGHSRYILAAGHNVIIGSNEFCKIDQKNIDNNPLFQYTIYDDVTTKNTRFYKRLFRKYHYFNLIKKTEINLYDLFLRKEISHEDHVFIPTLDWILLQSLRRLLLKLTDRPVLHLSVVFDKGGWITGGYPYNKIINCLKSFNAESTYIYSETRRHASKLSNLIGRTVGYIPYPAHPLSINNVKNNCNKLYIGALGGGRKDKGYDLLPEIIRLFKERYSGNKEVFFIIQKPLKEYYMEAKTIQLKKMNNVILLDTLLDEKEYNAHLLSCDINIFPYDPEIYAYRGSGIVHESVANAIPIICSSRTSISESIYCKNGLTGDSPADFSDAIITIIDNLDLYRQHAIKAKDLFIKLLLYNPMLTKITSCSNRIPTDY